MRQESTLKSKTVKAALSAILAGSVLAAGLQALPLAVTTPQAAAATQYFADSMDRTVASGWGTPDQGSKYAHNAASRFSVSENIGAVVLQPGKNSTATVDLNQQNVAAGFDLSFDSLPSAGSAYASVALRYTTAGHYESALRLNSKGVLRLEISKTINGTKNVLKSAQVASGVGAGQTFHIDFEVSGSAQPTLKSRAYQGSTAPAWQIEHTDTANSAIAGKGDLRIGGYLSSSATRNSGFHLDNLKAQSATSPVLGIGTPQPAPVESSKPTTPKPDETDVPAPTPTEPETESAPKPESENVTLPSNAVYVSAQGSDSAGGSASAPLKTISKAIAKASSGQTIVVRAGTYHESVLIPDGKSVVVRNYPGETVWLDGAETLTGFTASSGGYVTAWNLDFDASPTYTRGASDSTKEAWGFVNANYPMAANPEQVWISGERQTQVQNLAALKAGTFYVDKSANKLYLGTNPNGKKVEASTLIKAMSIRAAKTTVDGINVKRFSPSVPDMGAITAEKSGITLKNLSVQDSATTGINVSATNNTISNVKISGSGMLGMNAVYADGLQVQNLASNGNNTENFNSSPVSGGLKITRSRGVAVKDSQFTSNKGPGLWIDESVYDSKILNNDMLNNTGHGLSLEISAKSTVANNRIVGNGGNGIKLNNTNDVAIWNNTISGSNRVLNIVQDARRGANKSDAGHDPRQSFPDNTMPWIIKNITVKNNVFSNTGGGNAIVAVEDYSKQFSAEDMKISLGSNIYNRATGSSPQWSVVWSKGAGNPAVYTTLSAFQKATSQDASSTELLGTAVIDSAHNVAPTVTAKNSNATALPEAIASLIGKNTSSKQLGAFKR
ncbi:right-handed parallel beta-helix repeat-containing protein [Glutamicibacter protophormiae]|uniref:right-handed parallel beta-helix repeat-containing protein n=1 Tax=Glutamicibacter protophormiae TaxID=37930 RepID=UPI00195BCB6F|nr:right-handed parallel beta-helix repeat-containing protein [Glutamicibacter protophormiae]QRQ79991.1 right-handed parallel beta-helix repeat-containing protein [Glutamicibacter protophormiae]